MRSEDSFRTNVIFAISSNLTIATVSALATFVLPKFIGVEEYGYWQLFVFYGSYSLLLQLGAGDGANLRYAGLRAADLVSRGIGMQALIVFVFTLLVSVALFFTIPHFVDDESRLVILRLTVIYVGIINIQHFLLVQMQSVGNFRLYSRIVITDRVVFLTLVLLLLISGAEYWLLASAEILSKTVTLLIAIVASRQILTFGWKNFSAAFEELAKNVGSGIKLTIATTSSMLILGVSRLLIDRTFGVAVFGAISLVLNLSTFFMIFVRAIGLVLLPTLRRSQPSQLPKIYEVVRLPLSIIPLVLLVAVYPMIELFSSWLPEYRIGIQYLAILMPIVVFESKMSLLVIPYLKTLRKENSLLLINMVALAFSVALGVISTVLLENLDLAILSIIISLGVRTVLGEVLLLRILKLKIPVSTVVEIGLVFLSIFLNFMVGGWTGAILMAVLVTGYIAVLYKSLFVKCRTLLLLIRSK